VEKEPDEIVREQEKSKDSLSYLTFDLGEDRYAVPVSQVEVVLEMGTITRVPKSPPSLRGVINHRGSVVPVVDLRTLLQLPPLGQDFVPAIVVTQIPYEDETISMGFLADRVHEVVELERASIEATPNYGKTSDLSCVAGIGKRDGTFIILLNLERSLSIATAPGDS
jgi:purine-binding chemotaxis protein CheW